jgi:tetratricopeptide (TPR) repeat protein
MTAEDTPSPDLDAARAAAEANPTDPDLQIRFAVELVEVGDPDASAAIARATELAPEDPAILTRAAILSFDNGELGAAKQLVHRAYAHAPEGFGGIEWLTFVLGRVLLSEGNPTDARPLLEASFDGERGSRYFGEVLARHLLESGLYDESHDVAAGAIKAGSDNPALPALLDQIDEIRAAVSELERSGSESSRQEASLALGSLLAPVDPERARRLLEQALTGDEHVRALAALNLGALLSERDPEAARTAYETALGAADQTVRAAAAFNLAGLVRDSDNVQARALLEIASESPDEAMREIAIEQLGRQSGAA